MKLIEQDVRFRYQNRRRNAFVVPQTIATVAETPGDILINASNQVPIAIVGTNIVRPPRGSWATPFTGIAVLLLVHASSFDFDHSLWTVTAWYTYLSAHAIGKFVGAPIRTQTSTDIVHLVSATPCGTLSVSQIA